MVARGAGSPRFRSGLFGTERRGPSARKPRAGARGIGNLDIAAGSILSFTDIASTVQPFVPTSTVFALINYSGTWNGGLFTYGGIPLADGSTFTVGSQQWIIDFNSSTGGLNYMADYLPSSSFVTVTAVPEPTSLAIAAFGLAGFLAAAARRRQRA